MFIVGYPMFAGTILKMLQIYRFSLTMIMAAFMFGSTWIEREPDDITFLL